MGSPEGCAFVLTWPFAGAEHSKRCQDERAQKGPTRPLTMNLIQTSPPTSPKLGSWLSGPSNSAQGPPGLPRCCSKPGEPWNRGDILAMQSGFLTSFIYGYHVITVSAQTISIRKAQSRQRPQTFAHLVNVSKNVSAMFNNHTILLFWLQNM